MKMQLNLFFKSTAVLKFGNPCKTLKLGTDRVIVKGLLTILFCFNPQFLLDEVSRFLPSHSLKVVAYYYRYFIRPADKATSDSKSEKGVFEMFVRKLPRNRSYLVAAGPSTI